MAATSTDAKWHAWQKKIFCVAMQRNTNTHNTTNNSSSSSTTTTTTTTTTPAAAAAAAAAAATTTATFVKQVEGGQPQRAMEVV